MALRSLGSTLIGRAALGSPLRKTIEEAASTPVIPGKGEPGSLERAFVEQPFERTVPPGSQKVVSVTPGADVTAVSSPGGEALLAGAMGQPRAPLPNTAPGANNQALFQGGISPKTSITPNVAAPTAARGRTPVYNSVAGVPTSIPEISSPVSVMGGRATEIKAPSYERQGLFSGNPQLPSFAQLGGHIMAAPKPGELETTKELQPGFVQQGNNKIQFTPTTGQYLAGKLGKVISNVGTAFKAPQLTPGGLGAKLQTFGGAVQPALAGVGSVGNALRSLTQSFMKPFQNLRSFAFR